MKNNPICTERPTTACRFLTAAAAALPIVWLVYAVATYGYDLPYLDSWAVVPLLDKSYDGTLTFSDLWAPRNCHRMLVPLSLMVGLARLTRWNHFAEMAVNVFLGVGVYLTLLHMLRRTSAGVAGRLRVWPLVPVLSVLVFSLVQLESWLLGWHISLFLPLFAIIAGLALLAHPGCGWLRWCGAVGLGALATFSRGEALIFWPAGFVVQLLVRARSPKEQACRLIVWTAAAALLLVLFLWGMSGTLSGTDLLQGLKHPVQFLLFVLVYLGSSLLNFSPTGEVFAGTVGLVAWLALVAYLLRGRCVRPELLALWIALGLFAIGSAAMTAAVRLPFGYLHATSSRYTTFSAPFWISLVVLINLSGARADAGQRRDHPERSPAFLATLVVCALFLVSSACSYWYFAQKDPVVKRARAELFRLEDETLMRRLHPDPAALPPWVDVLREHRLSVFRNVRPDPRGNVSDKAPSTT